MKTVRLFLSSIVSRCLKRKDFEWRYGDLEVSEGHKGVDSGGKLERLQESHSAPVDAAACSSSVVKNDEWTSTWFNQIW